MKALRALGAAAALLAAAGASAHEMNVLEVPSPRWARVILGYVVGCLGAYWTIAQMAKLLGGRG